MRNLENAIDLTLLELLFSLVWQSFVGNPFSGSKIFNPFYNILPCFCKMIFCIGFYILELQ